MQPERPKSWPLVGLTAVFVMHVFFVLTPPIIGGKPYGMTVAWGLILGFAVMVHRAMWSQYRAYQGDSPPERETEP
jgi:hypothetical protein